MANNPFKAKISLFQQHSGRATSSNPRQQGKMRNPFERKILIPESSNHSKKKETKSKSLYSQRQHSGEKQNIFNNLENSEGRKYFNSYSSISIIEEGFRKQKIIQLERKYSEVFGFQTLRYQYHGDHKNKQYFNEKSVGNNQMKRNKIFSQSCSTYSQLGAKMSKQKRELKKKNKNKAKTKKMLSWNIENENEQKQIRRSSQNQYSSCKNTDQNHTFGAIDAEIFENKIFDNKKNFFKKISIQKVQLQEKEAVPQELSQDYVVQLASSYKEDNKLSSSSSSFFTASNCNNLKYGSNFQGIIYKRPWENHSSMHKKAIQSNITNSFPTSIEYSGKKFDLIRF